MFKVFVEQWNQPEIYAGQFPSLAKAEECVRAYKLQDARAKARIESVSESKESKESK